MVSPWAFAFHAIVAGDHRQHGGDQQIHGEGGQQEQGTGDSGGPAEGEADGMETGRGHALAG